MTYNLSQNKRALVWLSGGHFINDIYTGILNPIMPFIAAKIGISMGIAAVILTVSHIFSSLLQPIFGFFADSIRKRSFIFWGLIMSAVFIPAAVASGNIVILILFIMLGSLGSSFFHPQSLGFTSYFAQNTKAAKAIAVFIACGT
ncbi:MFS transporter, partial [bacterium]|nr:MFS transporter [bacterium]